MMSIFMSIRHMNRKMSHWSHKEKNANALIVWDTINHKELPYETRGIIFTFVWRYQKNIAYFLLIT